MSRITITSKGDAIKNGKYFYIPLEYKDGGKDFKKKVMDFANREVYNEIKRAAVGDSFDVEVKKDDNGYWQWVSLSKVDKAVAATNSASTVRSTYETPEERARRQVVIVRQNALTNSVTYLMARENVAQDLESVLDVAAQFEAWVMRPDLPTDGMEGDN